MLFSRWWQKLINPQARHPRQSRSRFAPRPRAKLALENLECRLAPATVSDGGSSTLTIALGTNENLAIISNGSTCTFSSNQAFSNGGVSNPGDFSGFGTTSLTLQPSGISRYSTLIKITDNGTASNATVTFSNSGTNVYANNFSVALSDSNLASAISWKGTSSFATTNLGASTTLSPSNLAIAPTSGAGVLNLNGGNPTLTSSTSFIVGGGTGAGALNQTSGTVNLSISNSQYLELGSDSSSSAAYGSYVLSGGTLNVNNASGIRLGRSGVGILTQTGGTITLSRFLAIAANTGVGGKGTATFTGGTLTTDTTRGILVGDTNGGTAVMNVGTEAGGVATIVSQASGGLQVTNGNMSSTGTGTLNLDSGTLQMNAGSITKAATAAGVTAVVNINGGVLSAGANGLTLVDNTLNSVNVYRGGARFNTNSNSATVSANLLASPGNGIYPAGGVLAIHSGGGSAYIGAPLVTVSGGSGSGALAVANVSGGVVTGVTLTNPGRNYLAGDVITFGFTGGGATTPATNFVYTLTAADVASNATGGLGKLGIGTLTLSGANTYSGPTTINGGTLKLAAGSNNNIAASSTITVTSGTFLDTSGLLSSTLKLAGGQTLDGSGTLTGGTLEGLSASTVQPGLRGSSILNTGNLILDSGANFNVALNGTTAGTGYGQVDVTGSLTLNGATLNATLGYSPANFDSFTIIHNTGSGTVTGAFNGLPEGSTFTLGGTTFKITYAGGTNHNDVVLTVQAPTTAGITAPTVTYNANGLVTVAVSAIGGTPTGTVQLSVDGGTPQSQPLANGTATFTLASPSAGDYNLTAIYAAQGNFLGSTATGTLHVNQAATTTALAAPDVTYNGNCTVTVTESSTAGTPTGTVQLSVDGGVPQSQPLTNGSATFTLASPSAGDHSLNATYAAQGNFLGSSATGVFHVNPAPTAVTIQVASVTYNANGTANVTVTSGAGTPAGTVTLSVDGEPAQVQTLSDGAAVFTIPSPTAGTHSLHAEYPAQGNFAASSADALLNVNQAPTTMAIAVPTVTFNGDGTVTLTVAAPDGVPTPTGSVMLTVDGGSAQSATLAADGTASFTLLSPAAGDHTLHAVYAAQGNYAGSSADSILHVNQAPTTTIISAPTVTYNTNGTVTLTVSAPLGVPAPTGTVSLTIDSGTPQPATLTADGTATFTVSNPSAGDHALHAVYASQGNYFGSSADGILHVNPADLYLTANASSKTYGGTATDSGTISGVLTNDGITASFASSGDAAGASVGSYTITATLADPNGKLGNYTVHETNATLIVNPANLYVTAQDNSKTYGQTATDSGTISGVLNNDGITTSFASAGDGASAGVGNYPITGSLFDPNGRLGNYTVTNIPGTLTVTPATLTVTPDNQVRVYGQANPTLTASFSGLVNGDTTAVLSGAPLLSTTAMLTSPVGTYPITVAQGSLTAVNYQFAFSNGTLTVDQAVTSPAVSVSAPTPLYGVDGVSLSAGISVLAPGSGTPTGSVDFTDLTTGADLGTVGLSSLAASLTLGSTTLAAGPHTIRAAYSGDGNFAASAATATLTVLNPATVSGLVFVDFNNDGQVDFGEKGIAGVAVALDGSNDLGQAVHLTGATDGNGIYQFGNLRPGTYAATETQPAGYLQGFNTVGTINGSPIGSISGDTFSGISLPAGQNAINYNFGEQPPSTGSVSPGQTATIGFWNNGNGQALINALNGGSGSTQLGNWLAATMPNLYGATAGTNSLVGKTNAQMAAFFQSLFVKQGPKVEAQVLATALAVYVTNATLDSTGVAAAYGFRITSTGLGTSTWNVGSNGDPFGVSNNTTLTVLDLLQQADAQSLAGSLYNGNTTRRNEVNSVFSGINQAGDI